MPNMIYKSLLYSFLTLPCAFGYRNFTDSVVLRCHAETSSHSEALHAIEESEILDLDFWMGAKGTPGPVDVMMKKDSLNEYQEMMKSIGDVKCSTMIEDIDSVIAKERVKSGESYFESYHEWEDIHAYVESLAREFPSLATMSTLGNTYEGRPMKFITLSTEPGTGKRALFFDGGLHARFDKYFRQVIGVNRWHHHYYFEGSG